MFSTQKQSQCALRRRESVSTTTTTTSGTEPFKFNAITQTPSGAWSNNLNRVLPDSEHEAVKNRKRVKHTRTTSIASYGYKALLLSAMMWSTSATVGESGDWEPFTDCRLYYKPRRGKWQYTSILYRQWDESKKTYNYKIKDTDLENGHKTVSWPGKLMNKKESKTLSDYATPPFIKKTPKYKCTKWTLTNKFNIGCETKNAKKLESWMNDKTPPLIYFDWMKLELMRALEISRGWKSYYHGLIYKEFRGVCDDAGQSVKGQLTNLHAIVCHPEKKALRIYVPGVINSSDNFEIKYFARINETTVNLGEQSQWPNVPVVLYKLTTVGEQIVELMCFKNHEDDFIEFLRGVIDRDVTGHNCYEEDLFSL